MNLQKFCDRKALSGYGSALLYRDTAKGETLYHLLIPLETVPSVVGAVDTFEYDLLNCTSKGSVEGKETLDQKDVEFLWHRDNVKRLEALQGRVIDFLAVYPDMTGRKFSGTIKVRPNDVGADIARGTFTITPMSASTSTEPDVSALVQDTATFVGEIPSKVYVKKNGSNPITCNLSPATATISAVSSNTNITATVQNKVVTIATATGATAGDTAVVTITASGTGLASWETTILVEVEA